MCSADLGLVVAGPDGRYGPGDTGERHASVLVAIEDGSSEPEDARFLARHADPDGPGRVAHRLDARGVVSLYGGEHGGERIAPEVQEAWLELAISGATSTNAVSGAIWLGRLAEPGPLTERQLRAEVTPIVYVADRYLALGQWGTFLSAAHLATLGGREAVARDAPVHRVLDLSTTEHELVFLQLTPDINDATAEDLARLDAYLAPVLLPREARFHLMMGRLPGETWEAAPATTAPAEARPAPPEPAPVPATPPAFDLDPSFQPDPEALEAFMAFAQAASAEIEIDEASLPFALEIGEVDVDLDVAFELARPLSPAERAALTTVLDAWHLDCTTSFEPFGVRSSPTCRARASTIATMARPSSSSGSTSTSRRRSHA